MFLDDQVYNVCIVPMMPFKNVLLNSGGLHSITFSFSCVYLCVWMFVGMGGYNRTHMHMHVETWVCYQESYLISSPLLTEAGSFTQTQNLLVWLVSGDSLCLSEAGITGTRYFVKFYGSKLHPSHLCHKHFSHWAIFLASPIKIVYNLLWAYAHAIVCMWSSQDNLTEADSSPCGVHD
jgi:hypothetical protein